jgi:putative colanic acid biosynthesis acetyltransferase WcaF
MGSIGKRRVQEDHGIGGSSAAAEMGSMSEQHCKYQDLSNSKVPPGFRGRPAWFVQLWWIVQSLFFHTSPQFMYAWRRFLLRLFGAQIGKGVLIRPSVRVTYPWKLSIGDWSWIGDEVTLYSLGDISIESNAVVSQQSYLCTGSHDYRQLSFDLYAVPIRIEAEAWVASQVFIGPGVTVGHGAIVGAASVVLSDVPAGMICAGNPFKVLRPRPDPAIRL